MINGGKTLVISLPEDVEVPPGDPDAVDFKTYVEDKVEAVIRLFEIDYVSIN